MQALTHWPPWRFHTWVLRLGVGLVWVASLSPGAARAAWLELCAGSVQAGVLPLSRVTAADGTALSLTVSDAPSGQDCARTEVRAPASEVLGLHPLPASTVAELGDRFSLSIRQDGPKWLISDIAPGKARPTMTPAAEPLPLLSNLLPRLQATAFGTENRATVNQVNAQLTLQCAAGQQPAGARLTTQDVLPRARTRLQLTGHGQGRFELLSASKEQASEGNASRLGIFAAQPESGSQQWLPPSGTWGESWRHWAIACPPEGGQLVLHTLQLQPIPTRATAPGGAPEGAPGRATWVWQTSDWQHSDDAVLRRAKDHELTTLFITVPLSGGSVLEPLRLQRFVERATAQGVSVWAVEGDPAMVLPTEHKAAAIRAKAYTVFNRGVPAAARLQGVQFDVEPYLLKGHALSDAELDRHYLALVQSLSEALKGVVTPREPALALEMVVPFWWSGRRTLLTALAPLVDGLVVMDYRTQATEIYRFAVPFLDWGDVHGKNVRVALEAGPIATEQRQRYERADAGVLWPVQIGSRHFLLMLKNPLRNPQGASFQLTASYLLDGSATTFRSNMPGLLQQLPVLETMFSAWPQFKGMALHELP